MRADLSKLLAGLKQVFRRTSLLLLCIVALASASLIVVNYYSIRLLSGARAYINGESQYSKGQKDASAYLTNYIYLGRESDYQAFLNNIKVCRGDRKARIALSSANADYETARKGFLEGRNHQEDIDALIWVFVNFKDLDMFKKAIGIWINGDELVNQLYEQGLAAHGMRTAGNISETDKQQMLLSINSTSGKLTVLEQAFSDTLGDISRKVKNYVFLANVVMILVIVASSMLSAGIMIRKLDKSKKQIEEQNDSLQTINAGLDKFVYNVTHDLRSPVAALVGLIGLIEDESDLEQIRSYTQLMKESLDRQDKFIAEMLAFIKSKHTGVSKQQCSLETIVDNVIALNKFQQNGKSVHIYKDIGLSDIESDALKLQVILSNLVSNSIKYSDAGKAEQWVKVRTYKLDTRAVIEVQDNGVGIREKDQERIFDKFYQSGDNRRSSGIGLYLVKDAVTQLDGKIEVKSEPGVSSTFMISLPC